MSRILTVLEMMHMLGNRKRLLRCSAVCLCLQTAGDFLMPGLVLSMLTHFENVSFFLQLEGFQIHTE